MQNHKNIMYLNYVSTMLNEQEKLEQTAEEAAELAQASLKLIRASFLNRNFTPVTRIDAEKAMLEEIGDVLACLVLLGYDVVQMATMVEHNPKWKRWAERLGYPRKDQEV